MLTRLALGIDVPSGRAPEARRALTDAVVRAAEALRRPDDVYHMVWRERSAEETALLPIGPRVQELGERLHLALEHDAWAGRTLVWLALGRGLPLASAIGDLRWDPEDSGEPDLLLARVPARWAAAIAFSGDGASAHFRVVLYLPATALDAVEAILARLVAGLSV